MPLIVTLFIATYFSLCSWLYKKREINSSTFVLLISILIALFSAYFSHDSRAYQNLLMSYGSIGYKDILNQLKEYELFFILSTKLFFNLHDLAFFIFYASLSFTLKLNLFKVASMSPFITLISFLALYVIYFDGTVIRVGLGIAACYWSLYFLSKDRQHIFYLLILLSSLTLHYSLSIFLLLALANSKKSINVILFTYASILLIYLFEIEVGLITISDTLEKIDTKFPILHKLQGYISRSTLSDPFSFSQTPLFILSAIVYFKYKKTLSRFDLIMFNTFFLSFLVFAFLYHSQVIQGRFSEMLRFSVIFITPYYYKLAIEVLKNETLAKIFFGSFLFVYFFYYNYVQEIIADKNLTPIYSLIDQLKGFL